MSGIEKTLYVYHIMGQASGVVFANSEDEAIEKVVKAYCDHGDDLAGMEITAYLCANDNGWFSDNPDVFEVIGEL